MSTQLLDKGWQGFSSDVARDQLPKGVAYRLKDYVPQLAPDEKRGGWVYASSDLNALNATGWLSGSGWYQRPDISTDDHLVVVGSNGKVYKVTTYDGTGGAYVGVLNSTVPVTSNPLYSFWGDLLIFPGERASGKTMHKYYWNGSAYALSSVTGATYTLGANWGNATVLSGNYTSPKTVYFSIASDYSIGTGQTWDMPAAVVGVAALPNVVVVFGNEETWGLIGSQIPPGGDMAQRTLAGGIGCIDPRSIVNSSSWVIWAAQSGIYKTDGTVAVDITDNNQLGVSNYWRQLVANFKYSDNWIAAGGVFNNQYFISVHDNNGVLKGTLVYDLERQAWLEFQNFGAACYAHRPGSAGTATAIGSEELFFGRRSNARVASVSSCWTPSAANQNDGDGTPVLPVIETGYYRFGVTQPKRVRRVYVGYDMRSSGTPTLEIGFADTPDADVYEISPELLPATTRHERRSAPVRRKMLGACFRIRQTAASESTGIYFIEADGYALQEFRR